jgi:hypothetical protein
MDSRVGEAELPEAGSIHTNATVQAAPIPEARLLARRAGELGQGMRPGTLRALPDPGICRAEDADLAGYAACLVSNPVGCRYALSFGFTFFCRHPERDQIVTRTAT